jgi:tetrahydromethanopterin S-methyltransferase subunit D
MAIDESVCRWSRKGNSHCPLQEKENSQMKHNRHVLWIITLVALTVLLSTGNRINAQERQTFPKEEVERAKKEGQVEAKTAAPAPPMPALLGCRGPITQVIDVAFEGVKFTSANYFTPNGGGQGGGFDKTPVLSTKVTLAQGVCLDAHLSAIVGSKQTYGVAPLTLFQVTLTRMSPTIIGPVHMVGHFEHPYGSNLGPAVALEAERDVDMYASNFFQRVGTGPHEVPPGAYRVDVWWAGNGPGGAIGAAFVLKLYLR